LHFGLETALHIGTQVLVIAPYWLRQFGRLRQFGQPRQLVWLRQCGDARSPGLPVNR